MAGVGCVECVGCFRQFTLAGAAYEAPCGDDYAGVTAAARNYYRDTSASPPLQRT